MACQKRSWYKCRIVISKRPLTATTNKNWRRKAKHISKPTLVTLTSCRKARNASPALWHRNSTCSPQYHLLPESFFWVHTSLKTWLVSFNHRLRSAIQYERGEVHQPANNQEPARIRTLVVSAITTTATGSKILKRGLHLTIFYRPWPKRLANSVYI